MELSFSRIDCYMQCPRKYKLRYVDLIEPEEVSAALVLGSAVHGCLRLYYKRLASGQMLSAEQVAQEFTHDWEAACAVPVKWNGATPDEMRDQGISLIRTYLDAVPEPVVPMAIEQELRAPVVNLVTGEQLAGVSIMGFLDRIDPGIRPIELKTSSQSYSQLRADLSLQFSIYAYLLAYHHQVEEIDGDFEVIVKLKTPKVQRLSTCRDARDFDRMFGIIRDVIRGIGSEIFFPNPSHMTCPWCDYSRECASW